MRYAEPGRCPDCERTFAPGATVCPHCALPLDNPVAEELEGVLLRADVLLSQLRSIRDQEARLAAAAQRDEPRPADERSGTGARSDEGRVGPASSTTAPDPYVPFPRAETPDLGSDMTEAKAARGSLTVPLILVGVGALCLMVAGMIFLAVAWSAMGVGGRTGMLVGFTALLVLVGWVLLQGSLRAGVEGVWTLALGLVVVDLVGLRYAGTLAGLRPGGGFLVLTGVVLAAGGTAFGVVGRRTYRVRAIVGPQVVASAGLAVGLIGLLGVVPLDWFPLVCCLIAVGVAVAAFMTRMPVLGWGALVPAAGFWVLLVVRGLLHPARTVGELFGGDSLIMLLGAAGVILVVALLRMMPRLPAVILAGVAVALTAYALSQPVLDESPEALTVLSLVGAVIGAVAVYGVPSPWRWSFLALAPYAAGLVVAVGALVVSAAMRLAAFPWRHDATSPLTHPDPMLAGWLALPAMLGIVLAALAVFSRAAPERFARSREIVFWTILSGALAGLAITVACSDLPRLLAPVILLVLTIALARHATPERLLAGAVAGLLALLGALPSEGLTVVVALALAGLAALIDRTRDGAIRQVAACYSVVTLALGLWALVVVTGAEPQFAGLVVVVVLGLVTVGRRLPLAWAAAALGAGISIWLGFVDTTWLAVQLTVATLLAAATGVRHRAPVVLGVAGVVGLGALAAAWTAGDVAVLVVSLVLFGLGLAADRTQQGLVRQAALAYWIGMLAVAMWQVGDVADVEPAHTALVVVLVLGVIAVVRRTPAAETTAGVFIVGAMTLGTVLTDGKLVWLAVLLLAAAVLCTATIARHTSQQAGGRLTAAGVLGLGALGAAWRLDVLSLVVATVLTVTALLVDAVAEEERSKQVTAPYWIVTLTVGLWTLTHLLGIDRPYAAAATLIVLCAVATWRLLLPAEITAAVVAGLSVVYGSTSASGKADPIWVAILLAITAAACALHAVVHVERRKVGWAALVLGTASLWVALSNASVDVVEWYSLPPAVALLVYGVVRLRTDPLPSSARVLGPGLALALLPSLPFAMAEPLSLRTLLLGAAAVGFVVAGTVLRWKAPLVGGAVVVVLLVLRQLPAPRLQEQWWVLGAAGLVLLFLGVTWEARMHNLRRAAAYLRGLR